MRRTSRPCDALPSDRLRLVIEGQASVSQLARHVRVTGRVQGVFFRAWAKERAQELGISGWVRNCPDGRVEAHVEGAALAVEQMIESLREGPPSALVEELRTWDVEPCEFDSFEVRH